MSKMFPFITGTLNPLCGKCDFNCKYCWASKLVKQYGMNKYKGLIRIDEKLLKNPKLKGREIKVNDFIFFVDMLDMCGRNVPLQLLRRIFTIPKRFPDARFLNLTKNPFRFIEMLREGLFSKNCYLGATIESNRYYPTISKAPSQQMRLGAMRWLQYNTNLPLLICAEPLLDFDRYFIDNIIDIKPWAVAIGYDNYNHRLPEPPLAKTTELINALKRTNIKVFLKSIRPAWYEK